MFGNQGATAREGLEYSRSSEQTARKGPECLGIREQPLDSDQSIREAVSTKGTRVFGKQTARNGLEYSRFSEQTARQGPEYSRSSEHERD